MKKGEMHYMDYDSEGNLILTYDVSIDCHGKRFLHLGTGFDAVSRFCEIAKEGIPEATKVDCLWENNYLVRISGKNLALFLEKHYPEKAYAVKKIDPDEEYLIDCYDMS